MWPGFDLIGFFTLTLCIAVAVAGSKRLKKHCTNAPAARNKLYLKYGHSKIRPLRKQPEIGADFICGLSNIVNINIGNRKLPFPDVNGYQQHKNPNPFPHICIFFPNIMAFYKATNFVIEHFNARRYHQFSQYPTAT